MKHFDRRLWLAATLFSSASFAAETTGPNEPNVGPAPSDEVVVTGTNIRGRENTADPIIVLDKERIERSGYATTPELIRSLPQVFRGGVAENAGGPANALTQTGRNTGNNETGRANLNFDDGVNLRGLDAALLLVNGVRVASGDISSIPLTAIERIEVLPAGASSVYGSDAVGGVVNVILRQDYEGNQTSGRYGFLQNSEAEAQGSQTLGLKWGKGSALLGYEFYKRDALKSEERSFTRDMPETWLLPEQERHSVVVNAKHDLTSTLSLFGNGLYTSRDSESITSNRLGPQLWVNQHHGEGSQYSLNGGAHLDVWRDWRTSLIAGYSANDTRRVQEQSRGGVASPSFRDRERSSVASVDVKADGSVFEWNGTDIKGAFGGHFREEDYDNGRGLNESRSVGAAFAELLVPYLLDPHQGAGSARVELSVSARYEDYSDFGSSSDPKAGLLFDFPSIGIDFRTTYGRSFRAPRLDQLHGPVQGVLLDLPDRDGGLTPTAIAIGANPDLKAETAKTFTAGFDLKPAALPGFNASTTYFDTRFTNRADSAQALGDALVNDAYLGIVSRSPDPAYLVFLSQQPGSFNGSAVDWPAALALVDNRELNTAEMRVSGVDLQLGYGFDALASHWDAVLDASYLFRKEIQLSENAQRQDVLSTVDNPVDFRLRAGFTWSNRAYAATMFINHANSYEDVRFAQPAHVTSWTTIDLNVRYRWEANMGMLRNIDFSLAIQNLLATNPPWVGDLDLTRARGVHYDAANATPVGRVAAAQVRFDW